MITKQQLLKEQYDKVIALAEQVIHSILAGGFKDEKELEFLKGKLVAYMSVMTTLFGVQHAGGYKAYVKKYMETKNPYGVKPEQDN